MTLLLSLLLSLSWAQKPPPADIRLHLQRLGEDYSETYREEAKEALFKMGAGILPQLAEALNSPDPVRRSHVIEVMGELRSRAALPYLMRSYRDDPLPPLRCKILEALGKIGDPSLFPLLVKEAKNEDIRIRSFAIWALGEMRSRKAVPTLLEVLQNDSGYPVITAIDALGKSGTPEQSPILMEYLKFDDTQTRYVAALAIGEIGNPKSAKALFDMMRKEKDMEVQEALARSLGKLGGADVINGFLGIIRTSPSPHLQRLAEIGLETAGLEAVFSLLELLKERDLKLKIAAARILGALKATGATNDLLKMLRDPDKAVQLVAISALGNCGDESAIKPLMNLRNEADDSLLRQAALEAIGKIQAQAKIPATNRPFR